MNINPSLQNGLYFIFGICFAVIFFMAGMSYASNFTNQGQDGGTVSQPSFSNGDILNPDRLKDLINMIEYLAQRTQWIEADSIRTVIKNPVEVSNTATFKEVTTFEKQLELNDQLKLQGWEISVNSTTNDLQFINSAGTTNKVITITDEGTINFNNGSGGTSSNASIVVYQ